MDAINKVASTLNWAIDSIVDYFKENAVPIGILLAIVYIGKQYADKHLNLSNSGYVLSSSTSTNTTNNNNGIINNNKSRNNNHNNKTMTRDEELRLVRLKQQEIANERAKQAAIERKQKELEERNRKNQIAKEKTNKEKKKKLGKNDGTNGTKDSMSCAYNPMQPWSSSTTGYRPARRNVRRG